MKHIFYSGTKRPTSVCPESLSAVHIAGSNHYSSLYNGFVVDLGLIIL